MRDPLDPDAHRGRRPAPHRARPAPARCALCPRASPAARNRPVATATPAETAGQEPPPAAPRKSSRPKTREVRGGHADARADIPPRSVLARGRRVRSPLRPRRRGAGRIRDVDVDVGATRRLAMRVEKVTLHHYDPLPGVRGQDRPGADRLRAGRPLHDGRPAGGPLAGPQPAQAQGVDLYVVDWGKPIARRPLAHHRRLRRRAISTTASSTSARRTASTRSTCSASARAASFTTCYAALHPERVKNLILTITPIDFHADQAEGDAEPRLHQPVDAQPHRRGHRPPDRGQRQPAGRAHELRVLADDADPHADQVQPRPARRDRRREEAHELPAHGEVARRPPASSRRGRQAVAEGPLPGQPAGQGRVRARRRRVDLQQSRCRCSTSTPRTTTSSRRRLAGARAAGRHQRLHRARRCPAATSACSSAASRRASSATGIVDWLAQSSGSEHAVRDKIVTADEAIAIIRDGDTVAFSGFVGIGTPDELIVALERRFLATGPPARSDPASSPPRPATARSAASTVSRTTGSSGARSAATGRWCRSSAAGGRRTGSRPTTCRSACISQLFRDIARAIAPACSPRSASRTFVDPRQRGGKHQRAHAPRTSCACSRSTARSGCSTRPFPINVAFLRGTTADPRGNITMEREALTLDNLAIAMAAKNSGGFVIAQVERICRRRLAARRAGRDPGRAGRLRRRRAARATTSRPTARPTARLLGRTPRAARRASRRCRSTSARSSRAAAPSSCRSAAWSTSASACPRAWPRSPPRRGCSST